MRIAIFTTCVLTLLAPVALAQSVTYDYDRAANFSTYKTYAWTRGTELTDELNHVRVVRAIDAALVAKGLASVEPSANPDVLVAYHASFDARIQPLLVGTLIVEISDARTGAIVWRSLASSDIKPADKPENRDQKIAKATEKMFKNYPSGGNGAMWLRLGGLFKPVSLHP